MSEELHSRISENEKQLGELTATVGSLAESVGRMHQDFQKGIDGVYQKIDNINERTLSGNRPNWFLVLAAIAALGAYILLHTEPIKKQGIENKEFVMKRLYQLPDDYYQFGQNSAIVEELKHDVHVLEDLTRDIIKDDSAVHQHLRDLELWVQAIDEGGSRKWIRSINE
jgi:hypothetical protein